MNPQRNLPIGILGGLAICTVIYVIVGVVLTGMVPYKELAVADPLARALELAGFTTVGWIVALGAAVSMSAVLLVFQYGQPRIFFAMARDGLLPQWAAQIHPRTRIPWATTLFTGVFVAAWSLIGDAGETYDLTNIGTLFAFMLVSIGVLVLRYKEPDRPRPFRVPFVWPVCVLSAARLRLHHVRAAARGLGAVRRLAGDRPGAVFHLRLQAQQAALRATCVKGPSRADEASASSIACSEPLPLDGIRVLDLTRLLPGAYATLLLADLGADVIKVEDPRGGDHACADCRRSATARSRLFRTVLNRNKRSVTLDLRSPDAVGRPRRARCRACDVVIDSFRPPTARRLGVDARRSAARNPSA